MLARVDLDANMLIHCLQKEIAKTKKNSIKLTLLWCFIKLIRLDMLNKMHMYERSLEVYGLRQAKSIYLTHFIHKGHV